MGELNIRMSKTMQNETKKIFDNIGKLKSESNAYSIVATFKSKANSDVQMALTHEIKSVRIIQDYVNNFTDKIVIKFESLLPSLLYLYENRSELFCVLEFYQGDPQQKAKKINKEPVFKREYRAVLLNINDIFKSIPSERLRGRKNQEDQRNEPTVHFEVELISDLVYKARKKRLNVIIRHKKIRDVILYCIRYFGFSFARFVKPDNDREYVNFVIPPDYGIADIMSFMQGAPGMGVYKNGFCSYITGDCWYIFPRYGAYLPKRVVQIYSVGLTNMEGFSRYDFKESLGDDFTTHIVINGQVNETNLAMLGSENRPNAANVMIDPLVIDGSRKIKADGVLEAQPLVRNILVTSSEPISIDESINLTFRHNRGNLFSIYSDLVAYQHTTIEFTWKLCSPFVFHPGTEVCYNYDHRLGYKTIHGKCEYVEYLFERQEEVRLFPWFAGVAKVRLACSNAAAQKDGCI